MDRSAMQHAGIAAESVNGVNQRVHAALTAQDDADVQRIKDVYEIMASLKLLAQRLTLTTDQLKRLSQQWHAADRLVTAPAVDTDQTIAEFTDAMLRAQTTSRTLFLDLNDATNALAPVGWAPKAEHPDAATPADEETPTPAPVPSA